MDRAARENLRAEKAAYLAAMTEQADEDSSDAEAQVAELECLLTVGMQTIPSVDFAALRQEFSVDQLALLLQNPIEPQERHFLPRHPGFWARIFPGWQQKFAAATAKGGERLEAARFDFKELLERRDEEISRLKGEIDTHNKEVENFEAGYTLGLPQAVAPYFELVLAATEYPDNFPREIKVGYIPESKQLIVEIELPRMEDAVPPHLKYRYVRTQDEIVGTRWPEKARQALYISLVAQTTLRTAWEIFAADQFEHVEVAGVNAYLEAVDPSTGQQVRPCIVSLRVSRDELAAVDLSQVEPTACLKHLKAAVSRSPSELVPVRPISDLKMTDPRFIAEQDVLSQIDSRPNLMELSPGEFESLITNLFSAMGLSTKLTQASRDGGVDCVAFDPRPVLGGKVVIQAKRYKNTVGVSAVRDLFGTMHNEGASKGILVTTSGYGKATYDFANGKPVELITGGELLFLLKEHACVDARIIMPDDWHDRSRTRQTRVEVVITEGVSCGQRT